MSSLNHLDFFFKHFVLRSAVYGQSPYRFPETVYVNTSWLETKTRIETANKEVSKCSRLLLIWS